ncbi:MAG: glycoside hydrolase family 78 protein [Bifidobacteriaceae bacterium]|jgi:alpha-L-rhamnosidase|nr:glycoside hydrolase family 78 protein [Bifidobacteriaceae bacterium]
MTLPAVPVAAAAGTAPVTVTKLACQHPTGAIGLPLAPVYLHWQVTTDEPGLTQLGYQVAYGPWPGSPVPGFIDAWQVAEPVESSDAIGILAPGGPLQGRERRAYRVRLATEAGWSDWSAPLELEGGLAPDQWTAKLITVPSQVDGPAPMVRCEFDLPAAPVRALLHVTAHGWYEAYLNGQRVGDSYFAPEWSSYNLRLQAATYDVTNLLQAGRNAIGALLADGWYRTRLAWLQVGRTCQFGDQLGLLAQLEVSLADGRTITIATGPNWEGGFGQVRQASLYDGCTLDLNLPGPEIALPGFSHPEWGPVTLGELDYQTVEPRTEPPIRAYATVPGSLEPTPAIAGHGTRVSLNQNLAGWLRLRVKGYKGQTVTVRHAEAIEPDGSLFTRVLRTARATDTYTLAADGETVLEPRFTYHGFQYADVLTEAEVLSAEAVAVSSDMPVFGRIETSHELLNRFAQNVDWTLRCNFISVPSDCCQRDERLGWTGDAELFSPTAAVLHDTEAFYRSWLRDMYLEQDRHGDGAVSSVVPNVLRMEDMPMGGTHMDPWGRTAWADAATVVPFTVYDAYGSPEVLVDQLESMRQWVGHLKGDAGPDGLIRNDELQWGDWLDPDAPFDKPWASKVPVLFVVNAYFVRSLTLLAWAERLVGDPAAADQLEALAASTAAAAWREWGDPAKVTQTGAALAVEFGIAPVEEHQAIMDALAAQVEADGGRIGTGLVGGAIVLQALSHHGHADTAYRMLLRTEPPSWLGQVVQGATTVWERLDVYDETGAIRRFDMDTADGDVMLSLNHPAYGAAMKWVYENVAGLAPAAPGYRRVTIQPLPAPGVTWAKATLATRLGDLAIAWQLEGSRLVVDLTVPFGITAIVGETELAYGRHHLMLPVVE